MIAKAKLDARLDVDTVAKTVTFVLSVPGNNGEGDVTIFSQDITSRLSADDKRRLKHLLDAQPESP